ncbi:hypothetical protein [Bradyrhizobium sp. STM 3562]|uniref:hypothetical protein n=1 Tax=Bradyrhizobium sp. STM 3562 TaxID=578924 RepID=UPI00388FC807
MKLEECRGMLAAGGKRDTANLVSVAILDLRMRLYHIGDAELKALCEEMAANTEGGSREAEQAQGLHGRPLLRVVK